MNLILERVKLVCENVRANSQIPLSFKKLVALVRKEFRKSDIDLILKTKKVNSLETSAFYVVAFYDSEDDFNNETPIEVLVYHNFSDIDLFHSNQTTNLLVQIFDATVHELRHQQQSRQRGYQTYSDHAITPFSKYLADPDELDAYAFSIAVELLRVMPEHRAIRYMCKMSVLSKFKTQTDLASPNLRVYIKHFGKNPLIKKVAKKVYKHLISLDKDLIFR